MKVFVLTLAAGIGLAPLGCDREKPVAPAPAPQAPATTLPELQPLPSLTALNRGAKLFQEHCAQCHGPEAQGHPDWQTPGVVAAPPLNGTGNDWKRSRAEIVAVIENGAKRNGEPVMPGWKGRLSEAEINDVITWFQALWPPEVYSRWQRANGTKAGG
jgi:mono/diheme cytochrome c family protein